MKQNRYSAILEEILDSIVIKLVMRLIKLTTSYTQNVSFLMQEINLYKVYVLINVKEIYYRTAMYFIHLIILLAAIIDLEYDSKQIN